MTLDWTIPDGFEVVLHQRGSCAGLRDHDGTVYTYNMTLLPPQARAFEPADINLLQPRVLRYLRCAAKLVEEQDPLAPQTGIP